ncbi:MAG: tetratricopeptide repeat protein [Fibrobacteria bacterium]|nr:tetratricopeptide repeat protein [Fibrobacteria bacterium]
MKEAIISYKKAIAFNPKHYWAMNKLAHIYLLSEDPSIHSIDKAFAMAKNACELSYYRQASVIKTLAMVYSEQRKFSKAVEIAMDASRLAEQNDDLVLATKIKNEIALYKQQKSITEGIVRKRKM